MWYVTYVSDGQIWSIYFSGIHLNFNRVLYPLLLQPLWIFHWHVFNFAENLQPILPRPGLAQCDGCHPGHLDFKQQENERKSKNYFYYAAIKTAKSFLCEHFQTYVLKTCVEINKTKCFGLWWYDTVWFLSECSECSLNACLMTDRQRLWLIELLSEPKIYFAGNWWLIVRGWWRIHMSSYKIGSKGPTYLFD